MADLVVRVTDYGPTGIGVIRESGPRLSVPEFMAAARVARAHARTLAGRAWRMTLRQGDAAQWSILDARGHDDA